MALRELRRIFSRSLLFELFEDVLIEPRPMERLLCPTRVGDKDLRTSGVGDRCIRVWKRLGDSTDAKSIDAGLSPAADISD
jgi:hypothetical protein